MNNDQINLYVLGAGRPNRGDQPSALLPVSDDSVVLDWIISAFGSLKLNSVTFVGGYRVDEIAAAYPQIQFVFNADWSRSGSGNSLLQLELQPDTTNFICYSDTVFTPGAVAKLNRSTNDFEIGIDRGWKTRYPDRSQNDLDIAEKLTTEHNVLKVMSRDIDITEDTAEFTGLVKISGEAVERFMNFKRARSSREENVDVPTVLTRISDDGALVSCTDISGQWAELNSPADLARFVLGSKADTLDALRPLVTRSVIDPSLSIRASDWHDRSPEIVEEIQSAFPNRSLAIRSSAQREDGWSSSYAGAFRTELNVESSEPQRIAEAIDVVLDSYGVANPDDQILVQEMVGAVTVHGVVTTRAYETGAPYFTINYDDSSGDTTTVTSGDSSQLKTAIVFRDAPGEKVELSPDLIRVLLSVRELERLVGYDSLDIEFAVSSDSQVHVLQVRPLTSISLGNAREKDATVRSEIEAVRDRIVRLNSRVPSVAGNKNVLANMPDWNPAEIIGTSPKRLALSLYKYLVTDEVWAVQRKEYGYSDLTSFNLMVELAGHPYIDTRLSLNSFIPANTRPEFREQLMNFYLDKLTNHPEFHDKIEFKIALTCMTFDIDDRLQELEQYGCSAKDLLQLKKNLLAITRSSFNRGAGDRKDLEELERRRRASLDSDIEQLDRAAILLADCKRFGTLPFAHMARTGFIAVELLQSLESVGAISSSQSNQFFESVNTVARQLGDDAYRVKVGKIPQSDFIEKYGHLRPGTYNIETAAYADQVERFIEPLIESAEEPSNYSYESMWDDETRSSISELIHKSGIEISYDEFIRFLRGSIEDREYSKFIFTRSLSAALRAVTEFGEEVGIGKEQMAHVSIDDILGCRGLSQEASRDRLTRLCEIGKEYYAISQRVQLPHLLLDDSAPYCFHLEAQSPNFVTNKSVSGAVHMPNVDSTDYVDLTGMIVVIQSADPGYDWLLAQPIAGIITMYGGINSHMAIRASELGLPAAIGVGEKFYLSIVRSTYIELNCASRQISILR